MMRGRSIGGRGIGGRGLGGRGIAVPARGLPYRGAGGSSPAYQQILTLAEADGWTAVYDPTNPDTRTLRSASEEYFSANADATGNSGSLAQATEADQPYLVSGGFGQLDGMQFSGGQRFDGVGVFSVSAPWSIVALGKWDSVSSQAALFQAVAGSSFSNTTPLFLWTDTSKWSLYDGSTIHYGNAADTDPHVFTVACDGTDLFLYVDGTLNIQTAYTQSVASLRIGARGSTSPLNGQAGAWALKGVAPSDAAVVSMQDLFHSLSGIAKA